MEEKIIGPVVAAATAAATQCLPEVRVGNALSNCATTIRDTTVLASQNASYAAKSAAKTTQKRASKAVDALMLRQTRQALKDFKNNVNKTFGHQ